MSRPNSAAESTPVVLALVGPTATGKTALSLALAEHLPVEVVSADSRMVYRWMDIGTAKPSPEERARVAHHMVDVVDPDEPYSVALYQEQALAAIARIHARGRLPLLVGGTGLYVRAVCDGLRIPAVPPDEAFRRALEERAAREGWPALQAELARVDPASAARIDPHNVRRVIRALEVHRATGVPFSAWQVRRPPPFRTTFVGLDLPRATLYERINRRVLEQIDAGLIEEVRSLMARGYDSRLTAMNGFGYREISRYLRGEDDRESAIAGYQQATRHYARRQVTWFRPDARITWFDAATVTPADVIEVFQRGS
ncbi:MAG TPA: tRNA (adenosine(37)-N6)-dimethylallyltransferase MiaA [Chloroflexota bacterium]|nr:tRNA (adenosine(37)-N6)-dimethylallyltransferase MiaA [Chloroflexota bacterium]